MDQRGGIACDGQKPLMEMLPATYQHTPATKSSKLDHSLIRHTLRNMVYISHAANVLILIAVCTALLRGGIGIDDAFGPDSPARRILACVYFAILLTSLYALIRAGFGAPQIAVQIALVLFPLQITYKLATAIAVGIDNPIVISNLAVAALHSATLVLMLRSV